MLRKILEENHSNQGYPRGQEKAYSRWQSEIRNLKVHSHPDLQVKTLYQKDINITKHPLLLIQSMTQSHSSSRKGSRGREIQNLQDHLAWVKIQEKEWQVWLKISLRMESTTSIYTENQLFNNLNMNLPILQRWKRLGLKTRIDFTTHAWVRTQICPKMRFDLEVLYSRILSSILTLPTILKIIFHQAIWERNRMNQFI